LDYGGKIMPLGQWIPQMAIGCGVTIELFLIVFLVSIPFGLVLTFLYTTKNRVINKVVGLYILVMRGTPLLLQIFFIYYGLPCIPVIGRYLSITDRFTAGAIAFIFNYGAYFAEIFRGGLLAVDKGQYEAAKVLGMTEMQTRFKIIIPQMFRIVLPSVSNEAIVLIKDTALITAIGLTDLLKVTKNIVNSTTNISAFAVAAVFYLVMSYVLTVIFRFIEKKLAF
jgi:polar amino acid transport system permease protein